MRFWLITAYVAAFAAGWFLSASMHPANSTELGVSEYRGWSYCYKVEDAIQIGDLYFDAGYELASSAWEKAMETKECVYENVKAIPQEVVWNRANMADTVSIVRLTIADRPTVYWFRLEPNR